MKVGSLVECTYGFCRERKCWPQINFPVRGMIYTVSDMERATANGGKDIGIQLEELINPPTFHPASRKYEPVFFWVKRFREVQPPMDLSFIEEAQIVETA